jgi:hypothetical protein
MDIADDSSSYQSIHECIDSERDVATFTWSNHESLQRDFYGYVVLFSVHQGSFPWNKFNEPNDSLQGKVLEEFFSSSEKLTSLHLIG